MISDRTNKFDPFDFFESCDAHVGALDLCGRLQGVSSITTRTSHDSRVTVDGLVEGTSSRPHAVVSRITLEQTAAHFYSLMIEFNASWQRLEEIRRSVNQ